MTEITTADQPASTPPVAGEHTDENLADPDPDAHQKTEQPAEISSAGAPGILLAMDGSESATDALRWAAAEAALRQQPLVIVNVYSPRIGGYPGDASGALLEVLRTSSAEVLTDAVAAVKAHQPDLTVTALTRTGGVIPLLIEEARGKELAVVGSRGLGGFTGLLLGSVGMGLASHAPCPVAVIRGTAPLPSVGSPAPVVVGVDGSHDADRALLAAFREARLRRCPLRVVHAWQDPTTDIYTTDDNHRVKLEEFDESAWRSYAATTLDAGLAPTLATFPDVEVEQVVDWRRPTIALQDLAKGAQLLVVGSRGRGAFKGLVMGSTSRVMIQHAPCPVLVVPSHPEVVPAHPKAADVAG